MGTNGTRRVFATLLLTALLAACGGGGGGGSNSSSTPSSLTPFDDTPRFAFVVNADVIGGYVVDPENGNLVPRGNSQKFFETMTEAAVPSPDGRFLYFSDIGGIPAIKRYAINPYTGTHSYAQGKEYDVAGSFVRQMLIHPSGKFLFYRSGGNNPITTLAIDTASGDLSPVGQTASITAVEILLSTDGAYLYATVSAGGFNREIQTYSVAADGNLAAVDADAAMGGTQPQAFADSSVPTLNPANVDFYMVNVSGTGSIDRYRRSGNGLLDFVDNTPMENVAVSTFGSWVDGFLVGPKGLFGYVRVGSDLIAGFTIDPDDGALTAIDYDAVAAGIQHFDSGLPANSIRVVSFEPSGNFVYFGLANLSGTLEKFRIDQVTGQLSRATVKPELDQILGLRGLIDDIVFTNRTGVEPPGPTFAYSRQSGSSIGIHAIDPATGMITDVGGFTVPSYSFLQVDPAQIYLYLSERGAGGSITRLRIDPETGALSDREARSNTSPNMFHAPRFDPHNRFAVQTEISGLGLDFMEVVTGPPGGLGNPYTSVQFTNDPYTVSNLGGASAARPNSRQIYTTGLADATPNADWKLRLFNLDVTPVGWDRVDADPATGGHQDYSISSRAIDTVVEPLGRYLLTLETQSLIGGFTNTDNLAVYELDWFSGRPTIRQAMTVPLVQRNHTTASNPLQIALDPRGRFVYVPTPSGIAGFAFTRNTSGPALEIIDVDPITAGFGLLQPIGGLSRLAIDPTGQWLYSGREGFRIDPDTGGLESIGLVSSAPIVQIIGRL